MSDDARKVRRKLSALTKSLDDLETSLASLLSQSLPDLVIGLDTIQQAKLQVIIPYLVYDLVFVYLKTRGLDPKKHPVIAELDRVRQYFDKIKDAEDPAKRQLAIDQVAASRFIKHAIAQAKDTRPITASSSTTHIRANDNDNNSGGSSSSSAATAHDVRVPVKVTEKMLEREKYHEALREEAPASDEGGDLEVFDGEDEPSNEAGRAPPEEDASSYSPLQASSSELDATGKQKGKGKAKAVVGGTPIHDVPPASETAAGKRRRAPVDPFAGYGDGHDTAAPADAGFTTNASRSGTKVRRIHKEDLGAEASSGTNTPSGGEHLDQVKRSKKRSKKKAAS